MPAGRPAWLPVGRPGRNRPTHGAPRHEPRRRPPTRPAPRPKLDEVGALHALWYAIRARILGGLIAALPIALTFWIVYWLYTTVMQVVLAPAIGVVRYFLGYRGLSERIINFVAPVIAIVLVLFSLYCLGLFVRSRMHRAVDWVMLHLPVVNTIFKAVNNVFQSLGKQLQGEQTFSRVVLVAFPHPGTRSLAFVTNSLLDATTGKTILCVCVLTGVMPPAGFTLFVPEEDVTDIDWSVNQTIQAILSGGLTSPAVDPLLPGAPRPADRADRRPAGAPDPDARRRGRDGVRARREALTGRRERPNLRVEVEPDGIAMSRCSGQRHYPTFEPTADPKSISP